MGDVAMALIGTKMARRDPQLFAPDYRVSLVSIVAEPDGVFDFRHVLGHHIAISAEAITGKDQCFAADPFLPVRALDLASHDATVLDKESCRAPVTDDVDPVSLAACTKPVDQLASRSRGKPVHTPAGMTGIVEIRDDRERQSTGIGKPFKRLRNGRRQPPDHRLVVFAACFGLDIRREKLRAVIDSRLALKPCARRRDQACRQCGRAGRDRIGLDHKHLATFLAGSQGGDQSGGSGADDDDRDLKVETRSGCSVHAQFQLDVQPS